MATMTNKITLPVSYMQEDFREEVARTINMLVDLMGFCDRKSGCTIPIDEVGGVLSFLCILNKATINDAKE